jgi:hypothetical protein
METPDPTPPESGDIIVMVTSMDRGTKFDWPDGYTEIKPSRWQRFLNWVMPWRSHSRVAWKVSDDDPGTYNFSEIASGELEIANRISEEIARKQVGTIEGR